MGSICDGQNRASRPIGARMTPDAVEHFRSFLKLRDFCAQDDPGTVFRALAILPVWADRQRRDPNADHDAMLEPLAEFSSIWMGWLLYLATIDRDYFDLAKRMAARTLSQHHPPAKMYVLMACALLVGNPPKTRAPKLGSHATMVIAIAIAQEAGRRPTESLSKMGPADRSGCGALAAELGMMGLAVEYSAVEFVWKRRCRVLRDVGFSEADVSEFFDWFSPMR